MADVPELFDGGDPPTTDELRRYLERTHNVSANVADRIVDDYRQAARAGTGEWTAYSLGVWIDEEVGSLSESDVAPAPKAPTVVVANDTGRRQRDIERVQAADARAASARARHTPSWLEDTGPSVDPAALATSMAVGVFTDAAGNVRVDPTTGQPVPVSAQTIWEAIKGTRFDMGALKLPKPAHLAQTPLGEVEQGGRRPVRDYAKQVNERRYLTPSMILATMNSLEPDYLMGLQEQLWEAGLFGDKLPSWGVADEDTRSALMALFSEASLTPDTPIDQVIGRLIDQQISRAAMGGEAGADQLPSFKPEVASAESLSAMIDDISQDLFGKFADPDAKAALVSKLQERETTSQREVYDRDIADLRNQPGGPGEIDAFMAAIGGKESGNNYGAVNPDSGASGKFQIMPANWGPWAERAGLGRSAPRTPQNQEAVARFMMNEYYKAFGNWRDVAIAWYAGPGRVGDASAMSRSQGKYPTIAAYADDVMNRFAQLRGTSAVDPTTGTAFSPIERFDPTAEAEAIMRAQDPVGWHGHQFAEQATQFYSLLQGVV